MVAAFGFHIEQWAPSPCKKILKFTSQKSPHFLQLFSDLEVQYALMATKAQFVFGNTLLRKNMRVWEECSRWSSTACQWTAEAYLEIYVRGKRQFSARIGKVCLKNWGECFTGLLLWLFYHLAGYFKGYRIFGSLCSLAILSVSDQNYPILVKPMKNFFLAPLLESFFSSYVKLGLAFVCTVSPQNT